MKCIVIEKDRAVFQFRERDSWEADLLLLVKEYATGEDAGHMTDTWKALGLSWEYALWPEIGERAGLCEVGRLSVSNDLLGTTPVNMEEYISLFRTAIKTAQSAADFFARFSVSAVINISGDGLQQIDGKYERESLEKFLTEHEPVIHRQLAGGLAVNATVVEVNNYASLCAAWSLSGYFQGEMGAKAGVSVKLLFTEKVLLKANDALNAQ